MTRRRAGQLVEIGVAVELHRDRLESAIRLLEQERRIGLLPEPEVSSTELAITARLRTVSRVLAGDRAHPGGVTKLLKRRRELERELLRYRRSRSLETPKPASGFSEASTHRGLVYCFCLSGDLNAILIDRDGSLRHVRVCDAQRLRRTLAGLGLTLGSLASRSSSAAEDRLVHALGDALAPILESIDETERATVVAAPEIGLVPWALLTETPVTHVPSLSSVHDEPSDRPGADEMRVAVLVGPDLSFAADEAAAIEGLYREVTVFSGVESNSENAVRAFAEFDTVHFATHGTFREDNALYSSVLLSDGPLTFFDLLTNRVPSRILFSACEVGRNSRSSINLADLFISRGATEVIACSGPANDLGARQVMEQLHDLAANGLDLASALRRAQGRLIDEDPSVALFSTFGSVRSTPAEV